MITSAAGSSSCGNPSDGSAPARASSITRRPASACTPARASAAAWRVPASSTSGAPSSQSPRAPNPAPLHFRADEKAAACVAVHPSGAGYRVAIAWSVALGVGSAAASAPRAAGTSASASSTSTVSTTTLPVVSVPVLSKQSVVTRASVSTADSSWISAWRRLSRVTATARVTLVSRTRPSGTMGTMPATVERSASGTSEDCARIWLQNSSGAAAAIAQDA